MNPRGLAISLAVLVLLWLEANGAIGEDGVMIEGGGQAAEMLSGSIGGRTVVEPLRVQATMSGERKSKRKKSRKKKGRRRKEDEDDRKVMTPLSSTQSDQIIIILL